MRRLALVLVVGLLGFRSEPDLSKIDPALRKLPPGQEVRAIARLASGEVRTLRVPAGKLAGIAADPAVLRIERSRKFRPKNDLANASTIAATGTIAAAETDVFSLSGVAGQTAVLRATAETAALDTQLAATDTAATGDNNGPGTDAQLTVTWLSTGVKSISVSATAGTGNYVLFITIDAAVAVTALTSPEGSPFYAGTRSREARAAFGVDGTGATIGIIDSGADFNHADLRTSGGQTRIFKMWDQTLTPEPDEASPFLGYGVEYTEAQINSDLDGSNPGYVRQVDTDGHGTHVAGTALNAAPGAKLVVIKTDFNEASIIDALKYFFANGGSAAVANLSLGTHDGPHDGTGALDAAVDSYNQRGQYVVAAAGNEGDDFIHAQATVTTPVTWTFTPTIVSIYLVNDPHVIDIWGHGSDQYTVTVTDTTAPTVTLTTASGASGTFGPNASIDLEFITIENRIDSPSNGATHIRVEIHDSTLDPYTVTLTKTTSGGSGVADGYVGSESGAFAAANCPVNVDGSVAGTIAEPGTAKRAIAVGAFRGKFAWDNTVPGTTRNPGGSGAVALFSSRGPTRDGRTKPDLLAPGAHLGSARSANSAPPAADNDVDGVHTYLQGSSMSAPAVSGVLALLLQRNHVLNTEEVKDRIASTLLSDALASGKIDAVALLGTVPPGFDVHADGTGCFGSVGSAPLSAWWLLLLVPLLLRRRRAWIAVFFLAALPVSAQEVDVPTRMEWEPTSFTVEPFARGYAGGWFSRGFDFEAVRLDGERELDANAMAIAGLEGGVRLIEKIGLYASVDYGVTGDLSILTAGLNVSYTHMIGEFVGKWPPSELTVYAGALWGTADVDKSDFGDFDDAIGWRAGASVTWRPWKPFAASLFIEYRDLEFDYEEPVIDGDDTLGGSGVAAGLSAEWRF